MFGVVRYGRWSGADMKTRFEEKFIPVTESGCWIWIGASTGRYGSFCAGPDYSDLKMEYAHRVSFFLYNNHKPTDDEMVCHRCDIGFCVNPDHLFIGTASDNMKDMVNKKRNVPGTLKLTDDLVRQIILYPENNKVTAGMFGIDDGHCSRIRNGKVPRFRHIFDEIKGTSVPS